MLAVKLLLLLDILNILFSSMHMCVLSVGPPSFWQWTIGWAVGIAIAIRYVVAHACFLVYIGPVYSAPRQHPHANGGPQGGISSSHYAVWYFSTRLTHCMREATLVAQ